MNNYDELIGKSIVGMVETEYATKLMLNDGTSLVVSCDPEPDCCGWNDFEVTLPEGFDFTDNVITKVVDNSEEDPYGWAGTVSIGIFTNDSTINIEGEYGSGSGWGYGQYVEVEIIK